MVQGIFWNLPVVAGRAVTGEIAWKPVMGEACRGLVAQPTRVLRMAHGARHLVAALVQALHSRPGNCQYHAGCVSQADAVRRVTCCALVPLDASTDGVAGQALVAQVGVGRQQPAGL
jgi:hypothetical protein